MSYQYITSCGWCFREVEKMRVRPGGNYCRPACSQAAHRHRNALTTHAATGKGFSASQVFRSIHLVNDVLGIDVRGELRDRGFNYEGELT